MAEFVAGFGASHSVMLVCTLEDWQKGFRTFDPKGMFYDRQGNAVTYDQLLKLAPANAPELVSDANIEKRFNDVQAAIARMAKEVRAADLDVMIICGDDQNELFSKNLQPAMGIYHGQSIRNGVKKQLPPDAWYKIAQNRRLEDKPGVEYPVNDKLALHLIHGLIEDGFDIASLGGTSEDQYEGHAFSYIQKFLMGDKIVPIVPIFLNTYFPPNQPTPRRCVDLGKAIGKLVKSFPDNLRVGFMASGGLSHFQAEEDLDEAVIQAMRNHDLEYLSNLDKKRLQAGSSEIRNWLVLAGACPNLDMDWVSYTPGYRTEALTGTGLGFATFYPKAKAAE